MSVNVFSRANVYISFMSDEIIYSNIQSKTLCWCCRAGELVGDASGRAGFSATCDDGGYETSEGAIVTLEEFCSSAGGTTTVAVDIPC